MRRPTKDISFVGQCEMVPLSAAKRVWSILLRVTGRSTSAPVVRFEATWNPVNYQSLKCGGSLWRIDMGKRQSWLLGKPRRRIPEVPRSKTLPHGEPALPTVSRCGQWRHENVIGGGRWRPERLRRRRQVTISGNLRRESAQRAAFSL